MQETLKYSDSPRLYDALKITDREWQEPDVHEPAETAETTDLVDTPEPDDTADTAETSVAADTSDAPETAGEPETSETLGVTEPSDAPSSLVTLDSREIPYERTTSAAPAPTGLLSTPLLAGAAALSVLVAGWSYTSLESTRAELNAMTQAKVTAERALADAQARLTNAEKAVAAVKAALTSVPAVALPAAAAKATEAAKDAEAK
ncbi:MAG: hypothetical protein ACT4N2_10270 [Hyphomicrobium sp.]